MPFTPRAKKVLELSRREAGELSASDVGPEHLLLGIVREGEGVAAQELTPRDAIVERLDGIQNSLSHIAGILAEILRRLDGPA